MINANKILDKITQLHEVKTFESIDSTNNYAKEIAKLSTVKNTLIIANHQSAGRGRGSNKFFSPQDEGLYMSLLLKDKISINDAQLITIASALAIRKSIFESFKINVTIKWINDIMLNNKKVGGILVEGSLYDNYKEYEYLVIGIGLNIKKSQVPDELVHIYTSLLEHTQIKLSMNDFLINLLTNIFNYLDLMITHPNTLIDEYKKYCTVLNKKITINNSNQTYTAIDINNLGNLVVLDEYGKEKIFNSGEVSIKL